jgi:hypothetical protein
MTDKYIQALQEMENTNFASGNDLKSWQANVINVISRIYGKDSKQEEQIKNINFKNYPSFSIDGRTSGDRNNSIECNKLASEIIKGLILDLKNFGLPENTKIENNAINISVNQSQNQSVQIHFIWESIKDELTGKQIKELEEVVNENLPIENKKHKIVEKLKSFGGNVLTNIVANILTNPNIFG